MELPSASQSRIGVASSPSEAHFTYNGVLTAGESGFYSYSLGKVASRYVAGFSREDLIQISITRPFPMYGANH